MIAGLLRGQRRDGGFGVHPYSKWTGAHWRLISLVELGVPATDTKARAAAKTVLDWIAAPSEPEVVVGKERRHASIADGGWNCDTTPTARRSSFHESLAPIWGLTEYHRATGDRDALEAAQRAGELLLSHRLFRSTTTGEPIHPEWLHIHWPHYWHYDFFNGLRALALLKRLDDPRALDALALLRSRRRADASWRAGGHRYWRKPGAPSQSEAVDWGDAHEIVTPAALAMLQ